MAFEKRSIIQSVTGLSDQLVEFKEYIGKLKVGVGEESSNKILSNSIFLVVAGSDDLANTYYTIGIRRLQYDISSYADFLAASASIFLQVTFSISTHFSSFINHAS